MIDLAKERERLDREITFFHYGRARRKVAKCLRAARRAGDHFFISYFLAQECVLDERFKRALDHLAAALAIRGDDACAHNDTALCLAELGKQKEALACFDEGIRQQKDHPGLYHNKGWLLNGMGRHREAILCFRKALELDADRPEALFSMADSYEALGEKPRARYYFERTLPLLFGRSAYMYRETKKRIARL
jgi:tetratricopeptide (TPR) repeat protein